MTTSHDQASDADRREPDDPVASASPGTRDTLALLPDAARPDDDAPALRLAAPRRAALLAELRRPAPAVSAERGRLLRFRRLIVATIRDHDFAQVAALLIVALLLTAILAPGSASVRRTAREEPAAQGLKRDAMTTDELDEFRKNTLLLETIRTRREGYSSSPIQYSKSSGRGGYGESKDREPSNTPEPVAASTEYDARPAPAADLSMTADVAEPPPQDATFYRAAGALAAAKGKKEAVAQADKIAPRLEKSLGAVGAASDRLVSRNASANLTLPSSPGEAAALVPQDAGLAADLPAEKPASQVAPPNAPRDIPAARNPFSTFSLNVTDAAFRLAVAAHRAGRAPTPAAMRAEEFVNSQRYRDPAPRPGDAFAFRSEVAAHPFAPGRQLLRVSLRAAAEGRDARTPLNLVLALDTSGSMERADRRAAVAAALESLAAMLRPEDTVSVVGFARTPRLITDRAKGAAAAAELRRLASTPPPAEGGTNLETALTVAYAQLASSAVRVGPGAESRVILLTDGAANLGEGEPEKLAALVAENRREGRALDCFGVGLDGYDDAMLERLARNGDGRYAFLNDAANVRDDFAAKLAGSLRPAARDVKVQVEFNPDRVLSWRLIGYDKHRLTKEQFRDDTADAAELAAAESGTAVYVVEPKPDGRGDLATVRVRHLSPTDGDRHEDSRTIPWREAPPFAEAPEGVRLAGVAALVGEILGEAPEAAAYDAAELAKAARRLAGEHFDDLRAQELLELADAAARR